MKFICLIIMPQPNFVSPSVRIIRKMMERLGNEVYDDKIDLYALFVYYTTCCGSIDLMRIFCYHYSRKNITDEDKNVLRELICYLKNNFEYAANVSDYIRQSFINFFKTFNYNYEGECEKYSRQDTMKIKNLPLMILDRKYMLVNPWVKYHSIEIEHMLSTSQIAENIFFCIRKNEIEPSKMMISLLEIIRLTVPNAAFYFRVPREYSIKEVECRIERSLHGYGFEIYAKLCLRARNRKDKYSEIVERLITCRITNSPIAGNRTIEKYMKIIRNERGKSRAKLMQKELYLYDRKQSLICRNFIHATYESDFQYEKRFISADII